MAKDKLYFSLLTLLFGVALAQPSKAVTITNVNFGTVSGAFTTTGMLPNQDQAIEATFSLNSVSNLMIYTTSYGGGTNANGTTAMAGGFMPSLVLFNSAGKYVAGETFPSPVGKKDPVTGAIGDAYLSSMGLAAGTYILAFSDLYVQQSPAATSLADGFINYGSMTSFYDAQGFLRNGNYALNMSATSAAAPSVPEPATFGLMIPALLGAGALLRKRKQAA